MKSMYLRLTMTLYVFLIPTGYIIKLRLRKQRLPLIFNVIIGRYRKSYGNFSKILNILRYIECRGEAQSRQNKASRFHLASPTNWPDICLIKSIERTKRRRGTSL